MEVNGKQGCLVGNILRNVFFYGQQKKWDLERHESEQMMTKKVIFGRTIPLRPKSVI